MTSTLPVVDDPTRDYGDKIVAVEPGGVEFIPLDERHGRPLQLLWTWTSPNMEFATVGVGILGTLYFGLSFWQALLAIVLGTALGVGDPRRAVDVGAAGTACRRWCSAAARSASSATSFPAGLNAVVAGIGWFAVNSVSGALALHALFIGSRRGCACSSSSLRELRARVLRAQPGARRSSASPSRCWP